MPCRTSGTRGGPMVSVSTEERSESRKGGCDARAETTLVSTVEMSVDIIHGLLGSERRSPTMYKEIIVETSHTCLVVTHPTAEAPYRKE
jgi:hypothetical protein